MQACPPISSARTLEPNIVERALGIGLWFKVSSKEQEYLPEFLRLDETLRRGTSVPIPDFTFVHYVVFL